jgi:tetratricopeptide (TPR) repeat protein
MGLVQAHEGPEHEIEVISERLAREGDSADLFLERAIEYRVLGRLSEASRDLHRAVRLAPFDPLLLRELAQLELQRGRVSEAMVWVRQALQLKDLSAVERSAVLMIRSQCRVAEGSAEKALEDCDEALRSDPLLVQAYLERSALQRRLGRQRDRIAGIEEGIRRTGAGLLSAERVEAFLDAGQWQRALEAIEPELSASRLQGTWKIRRARALQGAGRKAEAERDLRSALEEIESRLQPGVREPSLLLERGLARELLGEREAALKDYQSAVDCGGGDEAISAVKRLRSSRRQRSVWPWRSRKVEEVSRPGG